MCFRLGPLIPPRISELPNKSISFTLNRPRSLNALTYEQVQILYKALREVQDDTKCPAVLLSGIGDRAFCAGGDVLHIAESAASGSDWNRRWFSSEFLLNYMIANFQKPVISLWKGIVMGGGVGISVYGSHRIATDTTIFAMPETSIGFFPDVGASYFLSHYVKPPGLGLYLGMTGHRLNGGDTVLCGLATHYVPQSRTEELFKVLGTSDDVVRTVSEYSVTPPIFTLTTDLLESIKQYFHESTDCFETFFNSLQTGEQRGDEFAISTMKALRSKCPLTVRVWFESYKLGSQQALSDVLEREYHMCIQVTEADSTNFREGVRATLIDKGRGDPPHYVPQRIEDVTQEMVDRVIRSTIGGDIGSCIRSGKLMY